MNGFNFKNDPETSAIFIDNPLISSRRNKNIRGNLVRSVLRQNLPAPAGTYPAVQAFWGLGGIGENGAEQKGKERREGNVCQ